MADRNAPVRLTPEALSRLAASAALGDTEEGRAAALRGLVGLEPALDLNADPLAPLLREVLALGQRHHPDSGSSPADYLDYLEGEIDDYRSEYLTVARMRELLAKIAAVALAGVEACDAAIREREATG